MSRAKRSQKSVVSPKRLPNKVYIAWVTYSGDTEPTLAIEETPEALLKLAEGTDTKMPPLEAATYSLLTYVQIAATTTTTVKEEAA